MENTNVTEQSTNEIMPMAASGETNFASLPEKTTPASGDMFLMEDSEDTKKINYDKLADAILNKLTSKTYSGLETTAKNFVTAINELNSKSVGNNAGGHNSIFRGKNLGSSVSSSQWSAIQSASFDDIFVGDYWVIGGVNWRVAALDYFYNTGDTALTKHHVVIVPDTQFYTANMNDTNTTEGAYVNSKMRTENLEQAKTTINNAFGSSHVLSHRIYLSNATSNGRASEGAWIDSTVDLMCEHMVYGNGVFSPVSDGSLIPNNYRVEKSQLPLFTFSPNLISNGRWYWLRDVISSAYFATVGGNGRADYGGASGVGGVRPYFLIG